MGAGRAVLLTALLGAAALAGCSGEDATGLTPAGVPFALEARILRGEDRRDPGALRGLLTHDSAAVRARACLGLGRIGSPGDLEGLRGALGDDDPRVRAAAAFGLGLLGTPEGGAAAIIGLRDADRHVRARAAFALSRALATGGAVALSPLLEHDDGEATREALLACWRYQEPDLLQPVLDRSRSPDPEIRLAAAYALMRMVAPPGVGATPVPGGTELTAPQRAAAAARLGELAADPDDRTREIAARGLGGPDLPGATDSLLRLLADSSWRVRVNALRSLGAVGDGFPADALVPALKHPNINVRLAALGALGGVAAAPPAASVVAALRDAPELPVRAAAATTQAAWRGAAFLAEARRIAADPEPLLRSTAARILGGLQGEQAEELLVSLLDDPSPRVGSAALAALAGRPGAERATVARPALAAADFALRAAAVSLLGGGPGDVPVLEEAWRAAAADPQNDVRMAVARAAGRDPSAEAAALLGRIRREDGDWRVRREAADMLRGRGEETAEEPLETGRDLAFYDRLARRERASIHAVWTLPAGRVVAELFPADAPLTVENFVDLARRGFFDGLTIHRVVPNFVVQDGDPRGDGNGGPDHLIRCEINQRRYGRGTLGMALDGKDTGGSQYFLTHTPQPHLDGGYTVFGQVTEGMELLDAVAQESPVLSVRIEEEALP